jgi:four helix bundle protein
MKRPESPLQIQSEAYAVRISRLYHYLLDEKKERTMSQQIYRSGTSIGANIAESRYAQSASDFISKLSIALKEAGETEYWLGSIYRSGLIDKKGYDSMMADNTCLVKMLITSIKTMKKKIGKE